MTLEHQREVVMSGQAEESGAETESARTETSETTQSDSPFSTVGSLRTRLTKTASSPTHSAGVT